jgi:hypothetical protein
VKLSSSFSPSRQPLSPFEPHGPDPRPGRNDSDWSSQEMPPDTVITDSVITDTASIAEAPSYHASVLLRPHSAPQVRAVGLYIPALGLCIVGCVFLRGLVDSMVTTGMITHRILLMTVIFRFNCSTSEFLTLVVINTEIFDRQNWLHQSVHSKRRSLSCPHARWRQVNKMSVKGTWKVRSSPNHNH